MKFNAANCGMRPCPCGMMVMGGDKGWKTHHSARGSHRKRIMRKSGMGRTLHGRGRRGRKPGRKSGARKHGRKK